MAERSLIQYQPVTGPVWREPVAEKLAWLPRGQQPARALPPRRLGDFVRPEFEALYKPERLEWFPDDRYAGRVLPRSPNDWSVYPPPQIAPAYEPRTLEWVPNGRAPQNPIERRRLGDFAPVQFQALYDPSRLEWQAEDRYYGRSIKRPPLDWTAFQQPIAGQVFDPTTLDWMPGGTAPRISVELRKVGDFQQPAFDALYKPAGLQWWTQERYSGKPLPAARVDWTVWPQQVTPPFDPRMLDWMPRATYPRVPVELRRVGAFAQPSQLALYRPEGLQWLLTGQQPARSIRFIWTGFWTIDPQIFTGPPPGVFGFGARSAIGSRTAADAAKKIGTEVARKADSGIGTDVADSNNGIGSSKA